MMQYHIVNTDIAHDTPKRTAYKMMLKERRAYVFGEQQRELKHIEAGDVVFLYHNESGICAVGTAKSRAIPSLKRYSNLAALYIPLMSFVHVDPVREPYRCFKFADICSALGKNIVLARTRVLLQERDGKALLKGVRDRYQETTTRNS
jgi:hypothetical protein